MTSRFKAAKLTSAACLLAFGLPIAVANAQTTAAPDPHHPDTPAAATPPPAGQPAAPSMATPAAPGAGPTAPQMGMMMGDMRQMMGMMQQMMGMMHGGAGQGSAAGGTPGGGMPMMGMMPGGSGGGGPGMSMGMGMGPGGPSRMAGQPGSDGMPGMFRHTEGILAFYKAELRITEAQTPQWNSFADAVRAGTKGMRDAMQRATTQPATATAPEHLERRVALLSSYLDAAKAVSATAKSLYTALSPEQRKRADEFMAEHMRSMRGMMP